MRPRFWLGLQKFFNALSKGRLEHHATESEEIDVPDHSWSLWWGNGGSNLGQGEAKKITDSLSGTGQCDKSTPDDKSKPFNHLCFIEATVKKPCRN